MEDGVIRLNGLPNGSGSVTLDDIVLMMNDPLGVAQTVQVPLSALSSVLGGGAAPLAASNIQIWAPNTTYTAGTLVYYLGITYRRINAGTTGVTFASVEWQQMTAPVSQTITMPQLTADTNNYALDIQTYDIFRISASTAIILTGITAGLYDGQAIILRNVTASIITIKHQNTASSAANRILVSYSGDYTLTQNSSVLLIYDATTSRWTL